MDDKTLEYMGERVDRARKIKAELDKLDKLAGLVMYLSGQSTRIYAKPNLKARPLECYVENLMEISPEDMKSFLEEQIAKKYAELTKELEEL